MTAHTQQRGPRSWPHVVIAGGGVAALEALIALNSLKGGMFTCELVAPEREFRYRPLMVAEPFDRGEVSRFDLSRIASEHGAQHHLDRLVAVDTQARVAKTQSGAQLPYDALLVATGAQSRAALDGALTFGIDPKHTEFRNLLSELEHGAVGSVVFALPLAVKWALPLYELALLTARYLTEHGVSDREVVVATCEDAPLSLFGSRASESVSGMLARLGISFHPSSCPRRFFDGALETVAGGRIACDRVVALPMLEGPAIHGLPHDGGGFLPVDSHCALRDVPAVYAAGDGTSFPIKQGGIATQQADCAAEAIAAELGAAIEPTPFRPVLRGMLLTGASPFFLRSEPTRTGDEASAASGEALWDPVSKIAGRHLGPYLASYNAVRLAREPLSDRSPVGQQDPAEVDIEHREMVELMLTLADADARWGDYKAAVQSLDAVEALEGMLTPDQAEKRRAWLTHLKAGPAS